MSDVRVVLAVERGHLDAYGPGVAAELRARYDRLDLAAVRARIERIRAEVGRLPVVEQRLLEFDPDVGDDVAAVAVDEVTYRRPLSGPVPHKARGSRRRRT
jgi:hypothetical protein